MALTEPCIRFTNAQVFDPMIGETLWVGSIATVSWAAAAAAARPAETNGDRTGEEGEIDLWLVGITGESGDEILIARDIGANCMVCQKTTASVSGLCF